MKNTIAEQAINSNSNENAISQQTTDMLAKAILNDISKSNVKMTDKNDLLNAIQSGIQSTVASVLQSLLNAEMSVHLGAERYERINTPESASCEAQEESIEQEKKDLPKRNYRNGYYDRKLKTQYGELAFKMPRDRQGTFDPVKVPKGNNADGFILREEVLKLASMGNSVRDIQETIGSLLNVDVSHQYVQDIIESFQTEYEQWSQSAVEPFYPFVFVDCLYVNVRNSQGVACNKPVYVILGIDVEGKRSIIDISMSDKSSAETKSFWLSRFDALKQRGLKDLLFVSMDGVSGLEAGVRALFPDAIVQRCVVHLVRNSLHLVSRKDRDSWCAAVRKIYTAINEEAARNAIEELKQRWPNNQAATHFIEERFLSHILPLFELPSDVRKIVYTTNSIEAVNSSLRKVINKGVFGSEKSAVSKIYLRACKHLNPNWSSRAIFGWSRVLNQLIICDKTSGVMKKYLPFLND